MYNLKFIRENTESLRAGLEKRGEAVRLDPILELDEKRRAVLLEVEALKAERNRKSHQIGEMIKSGEKAQADKMRAEVKAIGEEIKRFDVELREIEAQLNDKISWLPNIPHQSTPVGNDESANVEIKQWGEKLKAYFPIKDHLDLGKALGIIDFERAAKVTGSGFPFYIGKGAALERALINYMLDTHTKEHKYTEVFPPFMVNRESLFSTGQIPKLEEDMYRCRDDELYLIPTAEVPITNFHRDETFLEKDLPVSYAGYTACFRREAGSYGKETRGFLRVHQFNKVE
ncbi:MAG: serine--tRNA ligase, partial [candidate division Zixibacteria bacterium]|nr:serine--tRNA ligase [Candidatus Tariuqbacter arcticus]